MKRKDGVQVPVWKLLGKKLKFINEKQGIYRVMNDRAVKEAKRMMNDRLEKMNHLQTRMDEQAKVSISRIEFEEYKEKIAIEIKSLTKYVNMGLAIWLGLQVIIGIGLTLLIIFFK
jgi:two-component sensor histidine kinase